MKETHEFLIPDYFTAFSCKMGKCRHACCTGWQVSVSMRDYFGLLGLNCRKHLRERLDCALRVLEHPTEEQYAKFNVRYDGDCPIRMPDGRCEIQATLGEDSLPDICRLYPRGVREENGFFECSCANSCEAVPELFLHRKEPLTFSVKRLSVTVPSMGKRSFFFDTVGKSTEIRLLLIGLMQDRTLPLRLRLLRVEAMLKELEPALRNRDIRTVNRLLQVPVEAEYKETDDIDAGYLTDGLRTMEQLLDLLDGRSQSIRTCGEEALTFLRRNGNDLQNYLTAKEHFESLFPDWELFYEHLLVNHMFFFQFPFQDRPVSLREEFTALATVYILMRFLGIGWMAERVSESNLTDVIAAVFRLIEHTEFDRYAAVLLRQLGYAEDDKLYSLIRL